MRRIQSGYGHETEGVRVVVVSLPQCTGMAEFDDLSGRMLGEFVLRERLDKPTPMIVTLNIHYTRMSDIIRPDHMITTPAISCPASRSAAPPPWPPAPPRPPVSL